MSKGKKKKNFKMGVLKLRVELSSYMSVQRRVANKQEI